MINMELEDLRTIKPVAKEPEATIKPFLAACCVTDPTAITPSQTIYYRYVMWCKDNNKIHVTAKRFSMTLLESGAIRIRNNGSKWLGFKLKE